MAESHDVVSDPFTVTLIRIKARQLCRRSDFSRSDYDDLRQELEQYKVGESVTLIIIRDGKPLEKKVELEDVG